MITHTQQPLFKPESSWEAGEFFEFKNAKRIAIDCETCDPLLTELGPGTRRGGYIAGISVAVDDGPCGYFPIRHLDSSDNLDVETVLDYFCSQCDQFRGEVVGTNLLYDLDYLAQELIEFPMAKSFLDISVAEALIDENQFSYSLQSMAKKWIGTGKDEQLLGEAALAFDLDEKKDLWRLPGRYVGAYAEADVRLPLAILRKQEDEIAKQDLHRIWSLESRVTPVLLKMVRYGVRVDEERLEACKKFFSEQEELAYKQIKEMTGHDLRNCINASARVAAVLGERGIVLPKTEKSGKDSVKKEVLEQLDDPVAKLMLRARRFNKAQGTFYKSIKDRLTHGRLHPSFHQLRGDDGGTVTGRLSSSNPNIQQQPTRDPEIGRLWRSIYVPEDSCLWNRNDFKAQEPRLFLHYAVKLGAPGAQAMAQRYRENPDTDPYKMICPDLPKDRSKIIFLGRSYNMGDEKLRATVASSIRESGITTNVDDMVTQLLYQFSQNAPFFGYTTQRVTEAANSRGYIVTLGGRKCRFPGGEFIYKATNRLIQSGAADWTKQAMVNLYDDGWIPHMAVHDELCFSVPNQDAANTIKSIMETSVKLDVPTRVDSTLGTSWGDCK